MRRFIVRIVLALLPCLLLYVYYLLAINDNKPKGDLSRMSYVEFDYEKPRPAPTDTLGVCQYMTKTELMNSNEKGIVVFGDSFSIEEAENYWEEYLGGYMGCTIRSVSYVGVNSFATYLSMLQNDPECLPDTVVVEIIERNLVPFLCEISDNFEKPIQMDPETIRNTQERLRAKQQTVGGFYKTRFLKLSQQCLTVPLKDSLFSDYPTTLFFYYDDTTRSSEIMQAQAVENLIRLDSLSCEKGIHFYVLAIPNKLTIYKRYISNDKYFSQNSIENLSLFDGVTCLVNPEPALRELTDSGVKDVFLPDDTHFSSVAGKMVARYLADNMKKK